MNVPLFTDDCASKKRDFTCSRFEREEDPTRDPTLHDGVFLLRFDAICTNIATNKSN